VKKEESSSKGAHKRGRPIVQTSRNGGDDRKQYARATTGELNPKNVRRAMEGRTFNEETRSLQQREAPRIGGDEEVNRWTETRQGNAGKEPMKEGMVRNKGSCGRAATPTPLPDKQEKEERAVH